MILNKGLEILVNIDGIEGVLSQTLFGNKTYLTLIGPEREIGNPRSVYTPFEQPPSNNDTSPFANVYRKLKTLTIIEKLEGPFAEENHPATFRQFLWFFKGSPAEMLEILTQRNIVVRVQKIPHKGNDAEVAEAITVFKPWMDNTTFVEPNPKIEEDRKRKEQMETWKKRLAKAERQDNLLRKYVYLPILVLLTLTASYFAIKSHWWFAIATLLILPVGYTINLIILIIRKK